MNISEGASPQNQSKVPGPFEMNKLHLAPAYNAARQLMSLEAKGSV